MALRCRRAGAVHSIKSGKARNEHNMSGLPPCVDGSELARTFFHVCSIGRVRSCVRPVCAAVKPLAIMLCADRVPIVSAHFKSAMTQTGSPDPRIDLVCITLSCPRQFLQYFGTPSSLPGLTSLNCSGFDATSLWHFDAAGQAPSTASLADIAAAPPNVRFTRERGHRVRDRGSACHGKTHLR